MSMGILDLPLEEERSFRALLVMVVCVAERLHDPVIDAAAAVLAAQREHRWLANPNPRATAQRTEEMWQRFIAVMRVDPRFAAEIALLEKEKTT